MYVLNTTFNILMFADKYSSQFSNMASQYAYYHEEDESSFHLVDTSRVQKPIYQRGRGRFNQVKITFVKLIMKYLTI